MDRQKIIKLIKSEVIPAVGCTEPIAVSLCVAKATKTLGKIPEKIQVHLSPNILKNAMGVGIPGTGMIGLPIAIAMGALIGKSEYQLEVLKDCTPQAVEAGKKYIAENRIAIDVKDTQEMLYIEVHCTSGNDKVTAVISGSHTNFTYVQMNDKVLIDKRSNTNTTEQSHEIPLTMRQVYDFAMETPLDEIRFILETARVNKAAARHSFQNTCGHALGKIIAEAKSEPQSVFGDTTFSKILSYTSAACDARMAGAMVPVISNSGSGNQGISATIPVLVYAEDKQKTEAELIRALTLSHLTVIYIKQSLGRLSALCGCVVAATGSSCGITYLMGGSYEQITYAVKNMVANLTGMICDGAKPSCSLKVASGVSTAVMSAVLAMKNQCVTSLEGIVDNDVDKCIHNLTLIGSKGMQETDKLILDIMTSK